MMSLMPLQQLMLFSIALALATSLVYRLLTDPEKIREIKKQVKHYNEKMKQARNSGDMEKVNKFMSKMGEVQKEQMGQMMKPLMVSFLIFIVSVGWLSQAYSELTVPLPTAFPYLSWSMEGIPLVGLTTEYNWFWWYLVVLMPSTIIFRKLLGVE